MRKIAIIALTITLFAAGFLAGAFTFGNQGSAQASVPAQEDGMMMEFGTGWLVETFEALRFEEGRWQLIGQEGGCVIYRSNPGVGDPSRIDVITSTFEVEVAYPNQGVRVRVCPGFTVHFPPTSQGSSVTSRESDN